VGIVGTGRIGLVLAKTLVAMGCHVLGHDTYPTASFTDLGGAYVELPKLLRESDIISLHCPLGPSTYRMIDARAIDLMKAGVMLINTSRGGLVDTEAVIKGLKQRKIGYLGLDVYEQEADLFFENLSDTIIQDDYFQRLLTFPNVLVTGHQAYFTDTALRNIAETTIANICAFEAGNNLNNEVSADQISRSA
jgi:D-lactate dehydrogenase